ncbi:topoisomerase DNA-binding C4 zinc finger domain-containing protein [Segatella copri]|uniref:topoisomerase DNA-binding C4 zinc finger domain-containing protein n=1 Tax=Segatella copri TaxID=165179 RepID=UPI0039826EA9
MRQHEHNVHDRQYRAKSLIRQGVCPQCGGQLVLRKGRYGSFYGCSNYPKCKFTLNK